MSNIAEAKKKMEDIEKKLSDQQTYSKLSEEERLKLFQDYVLSMAQSNEEYHANEAKLAVQLNENLNNNPNFTDALKKMAKIPYGPDTLGLLKETCVRDAVFQHMELKSISKHKTMTSEDWVKTISELSTLGKDYVDCRQQLEEAIRKKDYDTFIKTGEDVIMLCSWDDYQLKIQGGDLDNKEMTPERKRNNDRLTAFKRSTGNILKYTVETTVVNGKNEYRGKITPESEQTMQELLNRLAEIHIPDMFIMYEKGKEKTEELKKRDIPEISLMEEEKKEKFLKKLGRHVQKLQTPEGQRFGARYMISKNMSMEFDKIRVERQGIRMSNGVTIGSYPEHFIQKKAQDALAEKNLLEGNGDNAQDATTSLVANFDGRVNDYYIIKQGKVPEGESLFLKYPDDVKKILKMSSKDIILREVEIEEGLKRADESSHALADEMIAEATTLCAELENLNSADKDSIAYQDLRTAMNNVTKIGTDDFYSNMAYVNGHFVPENSNKSAEISPAILRKSLSELNRYIDYYKRDISNRQKEGIDVDLKASDFTDKISEFIWKYQKKITCLPDLNKVNTKNEKAMLKKAAKNHNIKETKVSEKLRVNILEEQFSKDIKKHMNAYNKASELHRCSSYYKKVGKEMDAFRQKYNTMLQIEKDLHDPGKPYEPGLNKKLIKAVKAVKESIAKVRKANDEYIKHKKSDKEYGPNAKQYSQDRVAAVEGIDFSMKWLDKDMDRKMDYVSMDATFYGFYDVQRRNIVRKLEKEQLPELTKVAQIAVESMDRLCKMPNHYDQTPLTEEEMQKYRHDIAAIVLADYVNNPAGQRYIEEAQNRIEDTPYTAKFFKKLVQEVADSEAFKKAIPEGLSKDGITKLITEGQEVHNLRSAFVTNLHREKNAAKEAARNAGKNMKQPANNNVQPANGNVQPAKNNNNNSGNQPEIEEGKKHAPKQIGGMN